MPGNWHFFLQSRDHWSRFYRSGYSFFSGDEVTSTLLPKYFWATPTTSSSLTASIRASNVLS